MGTSTPSISYRGIAAPFVALADASHVPVGHAREGRIETADFYDLLARLRHARSDRSVGVEVSPFVGPATEPDVRAMITCAPTVTDAFESLRVSCPVFLDDVALEVVPEGRFVALRPIIRPEGHEGTHEIAAALLAGGLAYVTGVLGRVPDHHVVLGHARGALAHVQSVFGRISESTREQVLLLPRDVLRHRPRTANDAMFVFLEREIRARSDRRAFGVCVADRVRAVLQAHPCPRRASVVIVAEALGLCPRTLQRHLASERTSFERILGTVLRQRALDGLLVAPCRDVGIALGYSEPSAFHRAVLGWSGRTPGQLAESMRR